MIRPEATRAFWALSQALADVDGRVPCRNRDDLYDDNHRIRAQAASICTGCPVLAQCAAFADANQERFGVWAGSDRTRTTPPPAGAPKTTTPPDARGVSRIPPTSESTGEDAA